MTNEQKSIMNKIVIAITENNDKKLNNKIGDNLNRIFKYKEKYADAILKENFSNIFKESNFCEN